eukprot:14893_1
MSDVCITDSWLPTWVTIVFIMCTFLMLMITSIYSFKSLKGHSSLSRQSSSSRRATIITTQTATTSWDELTCSSKLYLWINDVWKRKSVYIPITTHVSDTATDFAAVVEFYQIASTSTPAECGINVWFLFSLSVFALIFYRVISASAIWQITQSEKRVFFQLLDIELYPILYLSHRMNLTNKSSPQRLISVLEAVFEAAPQSMIQMVYLLSTGNFSGIIFASSVLSFLNVSFSIIGDDKQFLES